MVVSVKGCKVTHLREFNRWFLSVSLSCAGVERTYRRTSTSKPTASMVRKVKRDAKRWFRGAVISLIEDI